MANSLSARVIKTMGLFGGVKVVEILCAVVRNKLLAALLGPAGVGLNGIFNRALDVVASATQLNIRQSSVRDISAARPSEQPRVISAVRWWAWVLGVFGLVVMSGASPFFSMASFHGAGMWMAFAAVGVAVMLQCVVNGEQAAMQGTERLRPLALSTLWGAVTGTTACVACYYFFGINGIVPGILVSYIAAYFCTRAFGSTKSLPRLSVKENIDIGKRFLSLGAYIAVGIIASSLAAYAFIAWIQDKEGEIVTGIYQAGYMLIVNYAGMVFTAISMEFYPRLTKVAHRPGMASVVISHEISTLMLVLVPFISVFIASAELIVRILYTSEFLACLPMITIGICGTVPRAVSYCLAYAIMARGDGRMYVATDVASSAIGLALNIVCYTHYGFVGLGWSYVAWYAIYTVITGLVCRYRYGIRLTRPTVRAVGVTALVTASSLALYMWQGWAASAVLALAATIVCARRLLSIFTSRR